MSALSYASATVPIDAAMPSAARCSAKRRLVYCDPTSLCAISSPGRTGCPDRPRSHKAIRSGVRTSGVVLVVAACQATIRCE